MCNQLNILIITAVFPPEPVVSALLSKDLENALRQIGFEVKVICPLPSRPNGFNFPEEFFQDSYNVNHLKSYTYAKSSLFGRIYESYSFGKSCYKYIKANKDKINCIYANTWPLLAQLLTVKSSIKFKIPIVLHIQDIYPESISNKLPKFRTLLNLLLLPLDKYILDNSKKIIVISQKMKRYLASTRKINPAKFEYIANWQDDSSFKNIVAEKEINEEYFTFMYLGNIGPVAGLETVIESFAKAELKNARLVIAGSGSSKSKLENMTIDFPDAAIEFCDVPNGKVPQMQAKADVMVLPIKKNAASSSIPSKLPAYMFSSKPIIASVDLDSDTANAIKQADCGWVVEPESISSLSLAMKNAVTEKPEILIEKGKNGFAYAIQNYSKSKNLTNLVEIIKEVAKKRIIEK